MILDLYTSHIAFKHTPKKYTPNLLSSQILDFDIDLDNIIHKYVFKKELTIKSNKRNKTHKSKKVKKKKKKEKK